MHSEAGLGTRGKREEKGMQRAAPSRDDDAHLGGFPAMNHRGYHFPLVPRLRLGIHTFRALPGKAAYFN